MSTIVKGAGGGVAYAQMWKVTQAGYFAGQAADPENLTNDTIYAPYLVRDPEGFDFTLPGRDSIVWESGDTYKGGMAFGIGAIGDATFSRTVLDAAMNSMITDSTTDITENDEFSIFAPNVTAVELPLLGFMYSQRFQSFEAGTKGIDFWANIMFPRIRLSETSVGAASKQANPYTYNCTPTLGDKLPNGTAFSALALGLENDEDLFLRFITSKPMTIVNFIGDGVETTFETAYKPTSTVITINASPNWFSRQGTQEALVSIVIASGLATMAAAGAAANNNTLFHQTNKFAAVV